MQHVEIGSVAYWRKLIGEHRPPLTPEQYRMIFEATFTQKSELQPDGSYVVTFTPRNQA